MKNSIAKIIIIFAFFMLSITSSKALVLDLYSVSGVNSPEKRAEMVAGYEKFKNTCNCSNSTS